MLRTKRARFSSTQVIRYIIMVVIALIMLLPLVWLFVSSIRPSGSVFQYTRELSIQTFIPKTVTFDNYRYIFTQSKFPRALFNSLYISLTTAVFGVLVNSAAGFAFAVFNFKGKNILFILVLLTFMMPIESIVIPLYVLVKAIGWLDTYAALIVPSVANGLVIFMFRQFLASIPKDLFDAARIDGLSWFGIYRRIALPLAYPAVLSGALILFIFQWEAFFWPLVATSSPDYVVVQVAIARNITFQEIEWGRLFGTTTLATAVPMLLYIFMQKYYTRSAVSTGFK
ncbi:MAG: carbohydrate ABC transporter permease [Spirochaetia bacterium]|nr:carbohydrate ABC transporter permease [Spirochaetia bacterium]